MKKFILILSILFLASPAAFAELNFVQRVIDANTLQLISGEKVRLTGLNIKEGKEKQGLRYAPMLIIGCLCVFYVSKYIIGNVFGNLF